MHLYVNDSRRVQQVVRTLRKRCPDASLEHLDENTALEQFGALSVDGTTRMAFMMMGVIFAPMIVVLVFARFSRGCS